MAGLEHLGFGWLSAACFGLTLLTAVLPWMNAEVMVLALPALAPSRGALVALVAIATAGQMAGKCIIYWSGRGGSKWSSPRMLQATERWRGRIERRRSGPMGLVLLSSAVGFPPFFVVTAMAGALKVNFPGFLVFGTIGRLVRFGTLVFVPQLVLHVLR